MKKVTVRKGMTLVEILLATVILVSVVIPVATLIFGSVKKSESNKSFQMGANMACNVMDQLLSPQVPYLAIDPLGGPDVTAIAGEGLNGIFPAKWAAQDTDGHARRCAAFTGASAAAFESQIFGALGAPVGSSGRVFEKQGFIYEIYWFAGRYVDKDNSSGATMTSYGNLVPNFQEELTFAFFRNPYWVPDQSVNDHLKTVLPSDHDSPYTAVGDTQENLPSFPAIKDPRDPRQRPGWPGYEGLDTANGGTIADEVAGPTYADVMTNGVDDNPNLNFPIVFTDLAEFNEGDEGGLLKMIVGVRWGSKYGGSDKRRRGTGSSQAVDEFWLVSMKGRLEEGS